jgi:hypothetical protein
MTLGRIESLFKADALLIKKGRPKQARLSEARLRSFAGLRSRRPVSTDQDALMEMCSLCRGGPRMLAQ